MKFTKRMLSLILVAILAFGMVASTAAAAEDTGFTDVDTDAWYAEAVAYCQEQGWMSGISATRFSPTGEMTRAMLAAVLYRKAGSPAVSGENSFTDTVSGAWYANAVLWVSREGIISGYGDGRFGVNDPVTREQLMTILWRNEGSPVPQSTADFSDVGEISSWALSAVAWAKEKQVVNGRNGNRFDPKGHANRAEIAAILKNAAQTIWAAPVPAPGGQLSGGGSVTPGIPAPTPDPEPAPAEDGFALIHGGTFQMGSPTDEPERSSDETQHTVTVSSFYMAKTEVTQKDYRALMGTNDSEFQGDDLPVTNITWYDAIEYCNKLSESEGLTPCYTISGTTVTWNKAANGYRLPTEAEWEYAARANTTTPFSFGDYVHNSDANCYNAYGYNNDASGNWVNGSDAYLRRTVEVTSYSANAYGLYNMHGNAAEWVWDWYGEYSSGAGTNPSGPESGNAKIIRGGGWNDHPKHIRSAYRGAQPADVCLYSIGIRPVRSAGTTTGQLRSVYSAKAEQKTGRTLIVYFSQTGNTEGLANLIHDMSGCDIFRLERAIPYSSSSNGPVLYGEALNELRAEDTPDLKSVPDIDQYDTILLGYCNWWSSIPASVRSFLLHDDFSGKTIVPFCSMGGGRFGQTISAIAKLAPDSVIKEGLEVTYSSYDRNEISAWLEKSLPNVPTPEPGPDPEPDDSPKTLVAYFSATNNTENIANHIKTALGDAADVYEILAETPYTAADLNYNTDCRANREQNDASARPAISGSVENMAQYDVIFLGYPIWWGQAPKIMYTFLESYDLSGKTIVPFCTSASSGVGSSAANLHGFASGAIWKDGHRFSGSAAQSTVENWLNGLGLTLSAAA